MNWNGQGNWNNGQPPQQGGYPQQQPQQQGGYPQQPQQGYQQPAGGYEDYYSRLDNPREVQQRDPFIDVGQHQLLVLEIHKWDDREKGPSVRATFEYARSTNPALVGTRCCKLWRLTKPAKFPNQPTDGDQFADFVRKMKGMPNTVSPGADIRTLIRDRMGENLARGILIDAVGNPNKKGDYVNVFWTHVPQQPQDIAQRRAMLDSRSGGAPMQAPQGPPPGYQMQQPPQGQWQPPAGAPPAQQPQGMQPQGYGPQGGPPQYAPQAPAPAPQGAPPQGGFLAQIPPWGK